jgi:hypothetical protein
VNDRILGYQERIALAVLFQGLYAASMELAINESRYWVQYASPYISDIAKYSLMTLFAELAHGPICTHANSSGSSRLGLTIRDSLIQTGIDHWSLHMTIILSVVCQAALFYSILIYQMPGPAAPKL